MDYPRNEWIAHYTSVATALKIIASNTLRFSSLSQVNDPREYRQRWRGITHGGYPLGEDVKRLSSEFLSEYSAAIEDGYLKIACFSMTRNDIPPYLNIVGQSYCLFNMWAHYANDNKGVALLFDRKKMIESMSCDVVWSDEINYKEFIFDNSSLGSFGDLTSYDSSVSVADHIRDHIIEKGKQIFGAKDKCWEGESEYRIAIYDKSRDFSYLDYGHSIQGVVLGFETPDNDLDKIRNQIGKSFLPIWKIDWDSDEGNFSLVVLNE